MSMKEEKNQQNMITSPIQNAVLQPRSIFDSVSHFVEYFSPRVPKQASLTVVLEKSIVAVSGKIISTRPHGSKLLFIDLIDVKPTTDTDGDDCTLALGMEPGDMDSSTIAATVPTAQHEVKLQVVVAPQFLTQMKTTPASKPDTELSKSADHSKPKVNLKDERLMYSVGSIILCRGFPGRTNTGQISLFPLQLPKLVTVVPDPSALVRVFRYASLIGFPEEVSATATTASRSSFSSTPDKSRDRNFVAIKQENYQENQQGQKDISRKTENAVIHASYTVQDLVRILHLQDQHEFTRFDIIRIKELEKDGDQCYDVTLDHDYRLDPQQLRTHHGENDHHQRDLDGDQRDQPFHSLNKSSTNHVDRHPTQFSSDYHDTGVEQHESHPGNVDYQFPSPTQIAHFPQEISSYCLPHGQFWRLMVFQARKMQGLPERPIARTRDQKFSKKDLNMLENFEAKWGAFSQEIVCDLPEPSNQIHSDVLGSVDPIRNIPNKYDLKRVLYINQKKRPQIQWMLQRVLEILQSYHSSAKFHIVDFGCGRGDLVLLLAQKLPHVKITAIDRNSTSIQDAIQRASQEHLDNIQFIEGDVFASGEPCIPRDCHLLLGLHACGGFGEFVISKAIELKCSFLVSTCCFRSNDRMALLSRDLWQSQQQKNSITSIAEGTSYDLSKRAMFSINRMRLYRVEQLVHLSYKLDIIAFPHQYSVKNQILRGVKIY